jgi:hypothetical protein
MAVLLTALYASAHDGLAADSMEKIRQDLKKRTVTSGAKAGTVEPCPRDITRLLVSGS